MKTKSQLNIDINKLKQIEDIKTKTALILESRQHVNYLIDLLTQLKEDNCFQLMSDTIIRSLTKIFIRFIHNKEMVKNMEESEANKKYKDWLIEIYQQMIDTFIEMMRTSSSKTTLKLLLNSLMKFVTEYGKYCSNIECLESLDKPFIELMICRIVDALLLSENDNNEVIESYYQYLAYDDVVHYTLIALKEILKTKNENEIEDKQLLNKNLFDLLSEIKLKIPKDLLEPKYLKSRDRKVKRKKRDLNVESIILCNPIDETQKCFRIDYERDADLFADVWLMFLRNKLTAGMYKKVLVIMDKQIMPHFRNPLTLTDFLVESYNVGGIVSLLSLSSLYILIQKCNLDYPKFYEKLYALLTPGIISVKYRPRFLFWVDVFLTTTHISAHIVASFIKRLSRIALNSCSDAILIIIPIIGNLLVRHPILVTMIRNANKCQTVNFDVFDDKEVDPEKTNAIESSLWEIKTLQSHWHPEVAKAALFINNELPHREWDISDILETNFDVIIQTSLKQLNTEIDLTFDSSHKTEILNMIQ